MFGRDEINEYAASVNTSELGVGAKEEEHRTPKSWSRRGKRGRVTSEKEYPPVLEMI